MKVIPAVARSLLLVGLVAMLASCTNRLSPRLLSTESAPMPTPPKVTIHTLTPAPTPAVSPYHAGAWVSDTTPPAGSSITVFAKFTHGNALPIAGVETAISVFYPGYTQRLPAKGWVRTNSGGLATFTVNTGDNPDGVVIEVTFVYQNHTYRASTFFATM